MWTYTVYTSPADSAINTEKREIRICTYNTAPVNHDASEKVSSSFPTRDNTSLAKDGGGYDEPDSVSVQPSDALKTHTSACF